MRVDRTKKIVLNEGRSIATGGLQYGGFPRIIKETKETEESATKQFEDNLLDPRDARQQNVATETDAQEDLFVPGAMGLRYTSPGLKAADLAAKAASEEATKLGSAIKQRRHYAYLEHMKGHYGKGAEHSAARSKSFQYTDDPEQVRLAAEAQQKALGLRQAFEAHPEYAEFMRAAEEHSKRVRGGNYGE